MIHLVISGGFWEGGVGDESAHQTVCSVLPCGIWPNHCFRNVRQILYGKTVHKGWWEDSSPYKSATGHIPTSIFSFVHIAIDFAFFVLTSRSFTLQLNLYLSRPMTDAKGRGWIFSETHAVRNGFKLRCVHNPTNIPTFLKTIFDVLFCTKASRSLTYSSNF